MRNSQFNAITDKFQSGFIRVVVRSSRDHKGKCGVITYITSSNLTLTLDDGAEIDIHYSKVDLLDERGNPIIEPCCDMTGREVKVGDLVAYSTNDGVGNTSHALMIGRITKLHETGALTATPFVENGKKIKVGSGSAERKDGLIHNSDKCLLLPVDLQLMTVWLLTDFEMLAMEGS